MTDWIIFAAKMLSGAGFFVLGVRLYYKIKFKLQPCYVCGKKIARGADKVEVKEPLERYHYDCWAHVAREKALGDKYVS